jgi:hypothetical protein
METQIVAAICKSFTFRRHDHVHTHTDDSL